MVGGLDFLTMPSRFDLRISQRTSFSKTFAYREADQVTVIPLTGATAKAQIRKKPGSPVLNVQFATVVSASAGEVTISLTPSQTADLPIGRLEYDVLVTKSPTDAFILIEGAVIVDGTVTQ